MTALSSAGPRNDYARGVVRARFASTERSAAAFFAAEESRIAEACRAMAERFERDGRLFVFGLRSARSDAEHVAVEFVHPVLVGKRALPALALSLDGAAPSAVDAAQDGFGRQLQLLGLPTDIALGISHGPLPAPVVRGMEAARRMGMLTLAMAGGLEGTVGTEPDFCFIVRSHDPLVVQEVQETCYHVFWELVHVFFAR